jgi:hypothetical protein
MKLLEIALAAWVLSTLLLLGVFGILAAIRSRREKQLCQSEERTPASRP